MKVIVFESRGTGFDVECHRADCKDVAKKIRFVDRIWEADSMEEAKADYESGNAEFEEESGEGAGYYWDQHVKFYPCVR
jgi:hypothetical protein